MTSLKVGDHVRYNDGTPTVYVVNGLGLVDGVQFVALKLGEETEFAMASQLVPAEESKCTKES
jgi:hypothetical protein